MAEECLVYLNTGVTDFIDPVVNVEETEEKLIVDNGYFKYEYKKSDYSHYLVRRMED